MCRAWMLPRASVQDDEQSVGGNISYPRISSSPGGNLCKVTCQQVSTKHSKPRGSKGYSIDAVQAQGLR